MTEIRVDKTFDYVCHPTAALIFSQLKLVEGIFYYHFLVKQQINHHDEFCSFDIRADHATRYRKFNGRLLQATGFIQLKFQYGRLCKSNQSDDFTAFVREIQQCAGAALEKYHQNLSETNYHIPQKSL